MRWIAVFALGACGRLGFDERAPADAAGDGGSFVEPVGELDPTFGSAGRTIVGVAGDGVMPHSTTTRGTGYLGLGVYDTMVGTHFGLFGLTADGALDASFGTGGIVTIGPTSDDFGYGMLRLDDDRIIVNGDGQFPAPATDDFTIGLIDNTGAVDTGFGDAGFLRIDIAGSNRQDTAFRTVKIGNDLVSCGIAGYDLGDSQLALIRYDLVGTLVTSFGAGGQVVDDFDSGNFDRCADLVVADTRLLAAGDSSGSFIVAAYDASSGDREVGFATGGLFTTGGFDGRARGIALSGTDVIAVGEHGTAGLIVRLTAEGARVPTFGGNGEVVIDDFDKVMGVVVQPNGKLIVAGDGGGQPKVARLLADGALDATFGGDGIVEVPSNIPVDVRHFMIDPEGRIVLAGIVGTDPPTGVFVRIR